MKIFAFPSAPAFLLVALPMCVAAASAQNLRSSVTTFDKNGNAIIQPTSGDENRSSVTSFDKNGVPKITYTSPPSYANPNPSGIQPPRSIAGLIANQNIYGQSAPFTNPGFYNRFGYNNAPVYPSGYFPYPAPNYGYPAPTYGYPVPGYQQSPTSIDFKDPRFPWSAPANVTTIPLTPGYSFPAQNFPYPYPVPNYGYPAPTYGYPVPTYGYPYSGGYGYGGGTYASNSANYGVSFGRGGFSASIGGSNVSSRSNSTTTITTY